MARLPDHILAPALGQWIPDLVGKRRAAVWKPESAGPRRLRQLLGGWPPAMPGESIDVVMVSVVLGSDPPAGLMAAWEDALLRPRFVIDLARPAGGGILGPLRGGTLRAQTAASAADRMAQWLNAGLLQCEQWVTTDPADVVVTLGRIPELAPYA